MNTQLTQDLWLSLEIFGTIIFAISGAISAVKREFDLTGVVLIACVVGNGGGTIRDLLIHAPVFWLAQWYYIVITMVFGGLTFLLMKYVRLAKWLMVYSDALGLGVFAIVGAQKALAYGFNPFIAIIMGMITGIGGGLIRDTLCDQVPLLLQREIYALAASTGAALFVLLPATLQSNFFANVACVFLVFIIRVVSLKYDLHMPSLKGH